MQEPKDKRTKDWKEWNRLKQQELFDADLGVEVTESYGLGDLVNDITEKTGIKKLVGDCKPCEERRKKWNDITLFKRHKVARCLTEEQEQRYKEFKDTRKPKQWNDSEIRLLVELYSHVFAIQYQSKDICRNCSGSGKKLQEIEKKLDEVFAK